MASPTTFNIDEDNTALHRFFSPKRATFRYLGLTFFCFLSFGSYFCYDNPGALQDHFKTDLNITTSEFVLLYSIYSWPNVILCFVGGFLIDSVFGIRLGTIVYVGLVVVGQLTFALGAYVNTLWLMVIGRFLYGVGAECLTVAHSTYCVLWYKGKELNLVFGLGLSFARIASTTNFLVTDNIYNYFSKTLNYSGPSCFGTVLFIASLTCFGSLLCALVLAVMDKHAEKVLKRDDNKKTEKAKITDIKDFKAGFWLISLICCTYYAAMFPFIALSKVYFIQKYKYEPAAANTANSLVFTISAIATPIFGFFVDKTGNNLVYVITGIVGSFFAHILLAFAYISPYICMSVMGISFSLYTSSFWSLVPFLVPKNQLNTAYGMTTSLMNLGVAVSSIISGAIVDKYGYFYLELYFLFCLLISCITNIAVWMIDKHPVPTRKVEYHSLKLEKKYICCN